MGSVGRGYEFGLSQVPENPHRKREGRQYQEKNIDKRKRITKSLN